MYITAYVQNTYMASPYNNISLHNSTKIHVGMQTQVAK